MSTNSLFQAKDNQNFCTLESAYKNNTPISPYVKTPDKPVCKCEYCGKVLHYECVKLNGFIVSIHKEPQRCSCSQAVEYWKKIDEEKTKQEKALKLQEQKAALKRRIDNSHISKRYQMCRLNNYTCTTREQKRTIDIINAYCKNFSVNKAAGNGLYIEGTIGTGKTHLAAAICYEVMKQGYQALFTTSNDLLVNLQSAYNGNALSIDELIEKYKRVALLVIDDLGKEKTTEWALSMLFNILNYRYNEMLPSVITTNYNENDLIHRLTLNDDNTTIKSIIDRLHQNTELITITGKSHR